jgi:hypothetical protein
MKSLPIFVENSNNGVYYPNNENIPFLFNDKFYNNIWLNKDNNPLRNEYYFASEYYFNRKITTLEQATDFMQKLYDLIEVKGVSFRHLNNVKNRNKRLHYYKDEPNHSCSTKSPSKVHFVLFDIENMVIIENDDYIKQVISENNADVNELYAFDFESKTMFPNLKCKTWV